MWAGLTWGTGFGSSSIPVDGSVLGAPIGVSKEGGCIDVSSGECSTGLVFATIKGITGSVVDAREGRIGLGSGVEVGDWNRECVVKVEYIRFHK